MILKVLVILIFTTNFVFASCDDLFVDFSKTLSGISLDCQDEIKSSKVKFEDGSVSYFGLKGFILRDHTTHQELLFGDQTTLNNVTKISISNDEVYIIDNGDIKVFSKLFFGNVGPLRIISKEDIGAVKDICVSSSNLYVKTRDVFIVDKSANSLGRKNKRKLEKSRLPASVVGECSDFN